MALTKVTTEVLDDSIRISSGSLNVISGSSISTGSFGRLQTHQANALFGSRTVTLGGDLTTGGTLTTQNNNVTINAVGAARTLTLNESLSVGDGNDGTITFSASSKTLTISDSGTFAGGGNTLTLAGNLTTQNNNVTINAVGAARTLTLNESLTVGDGNDGTITFSGASKTLTVEDTSNLNQDLTSDASPTFAGGTVTGNLTVGGTLTAQEIHTEFTSASIMFSSGSTKFGDTIDDTHEVTGSMTMSGSVTINDGNFIVTDKVGFGTNSPQGILDINASSRNAVGDLDDADDYAIVIRNPSTTGEGNGIAFTNDGGQNVGGAILHIDQGSNNLGDLAFYTNANNSGDPSERMRIDSSGDVGIGTNNPSHKLDILENAETNVVRFFNDGGDQNRDVMILQGGADSGPGNTRFITFNDGDGGAFGFIQGPANGATAGISFNTTADTSLLTLSGSRVGIGTVNPLVQLDIQNTDHAILRLLAGTNKSASMRLRNDAQDWDVNCQTTDNFAIFDQTNSSTALSIAHTSYHATFGGNITVDYNDATSINAGEIAGDNDVLGINIKNQNTGLGSGGMLKFIGGNGNNLTAIGHVQEGSNSASMLFFTETGGSFAERMRVDHAGALSVGTNAPQASAKLHIKGNGGGQAIAVFEDDSANANVLIKASVADKNSILNFGDAGSTEIGQIDYDHADNSMRFQTNSATRMKIDNSGNTTIGGSAAPQNTLHVQGTGITISEGDRNRCSIHSTHSDTNDGGMIFKIRDGGSPVEKMRIHTNGSVGIGTATPGNKFHVYQDSGVFAALIQQNQGDGFVLDLLASASDDHANDPLFRARTDAATLLQLMNDGRMILNTSHFICAGAVIPGATSEVDNQKIFDGSSGTGSNTLFIGNAQIQVSSDKRLKINIRDTEMNPIETLNRLRVVDFDWDDPKDTSWNNKMARVKHGGQWSGILAQEAVEVVPHIINAPRIEETLELDHESENTWQVEYEHLVPTLVKAIQELSQKNEALEKRIEELEK